MTKDLKKFFTYDYYLRKEVSFLKSIGSKYLVFAEARRRYYWTLFKKLHYYHPKDLNEKLMWLTRFWQHPLKTKCADKYLVREYVRNCGLEEILIPLIGVYKAGQYIDFHQLPSAFVLKCNHGSGFNIIVRDKANLDFGKTRQQLDEWLSIDYGALCQEIHYSPIQRLIVCEELLSLSAPTEYQVRMINGKANSIVACCKSDGSMQGYKENSYNIDWTPNDYCEENLERGVFERPKNLDFILECAKTLAAPFPFVRVDFYEVEGKVYFAEMTFTPNTNCLRYPQRSLDELGKLLKLPHRYIPKGGK